MESQSKETVQTPDYEIIQVPDYGEEGRDTLKQQCIDLRIEVFVHEQGFPLDTEIDELSAILQYIFTYIRY